MDRRVGLVVNGKGGGGERVRNTFPSLASGDNCALTQPQNGMS